MVETRLDKVIYGILGKRGLLDLFEGPAGLLGAGGGGGGGGGGVDWDEAWGALWVLLLFVLTVQYTSHNA